MIINLQGKNAVVCGSTQGIGKAIAKQLALSGASIILVARNNEKLNTTLAELDISQNQKHTCYVADYSNVNEVKTIANTIALNHTIHILINNTGGPPAGKAIDAKAEEFLAAFNNHLINNHQMVQALVPRMKNENYGRIINIISTSVKVPLHNLGVSNSIRGAVGNWAKTLANELAQFNITVNNILPGATETERLSAIITNKSNQQNVALESVTNDMLHEIPMRRFGKPEEVAYAATFLASSMAAYITGTNMVVDGGRTACL
jgi:3-oxoacyl-[acyl-carrier protein] reductase